jgi:hypothetical protein
MISSKAFAGRSNESADMTKAVHDGNHVAVRRSRQQQQRSMLMAIQRSFAMRKFAVRAAVTAALMLAASSPSTSAVVVGHPLGALRPADFGSIESVRCCGWGPRGWYDTWRHCHYCGFGHPNGYCRFSVRRWAWYCPR